MKGHWAGKTAQDTCDEKMVWSQLTGSVTVGTKGQVVIPKDVRELLDIKEGDKLMVFTKHDKAIGLVKSDDLGEFLKYMQMELNEDEQISMKK